MEKKHIYDLINVPLEGLCLSVMFLFTAGVIQPGHYPEWLNVVLTIGVVVLNLCYAFLKRGPRIFLKNCLYQLPVTAVFYFILHGNIPEIVCFYGWLTYSGTKIRYISMDWILSELYE